MRLRSAEFQSFFTEFLFLNSELQQNQHVVGRCDDVLKEITVIGPANIDKATCNIPETRRSCQLGKNGLL